MGITRLLVQLLYFPSTKLQIYSVCLSVCKHSIIGFHWLSSLPGAFCLADYIYYSKNSPARQVKYSSAVTKAKIPVSLTASGLS